MWTNRCSDRLVVALLIVFVWAGLPSLAHAQAIRGTLLGTVTDQSGAAVPGVTVTITETRTNVSHDTVTNATGNYTFPNLVDGIYNVKAELQGFKTVVRDNMRLAVNTSLRVDLTLEVGALDRDGHGHRRDPAAADRPDRHRPHDREHPGHGDSAGLQPELPGHAGHGPGCGPAVAPALGVLQLAGQPRHERQRPVARTPTTSRSRASTTTTSTGLLTVLIPPAEAIDQVNVSTSNYDAEFGRAAGAITSVTLKSGGNELKGSAFWFGNSEATNALPAAIGASTPCGPSPTPATTSSASRWAARSGRTSCSTSATTSTPGTSSARSTAASCRPRSSGAATSVRPPPRSTTPPRATRRATAGPSSRATRYPSNRISPIALALLEHIPLPNLPGVALGQVNYQMNGQRDKIAHSFDTKLNWAANSANTLSWRLSYQRPEVTAAAGGGLRRLGRAVQRPVHRDGHEQHLQHRGELDAHLLEHVPHGERAAASATTTTSRATPRGGENLAEQVGITGVNLDDWTSGPTRINIGNGFSNPALGYIDQPALGPLRADVGVRLHADEAVGQPHDQVRRRLAAQHRHAAADAGQPGPARRLHLRRRDDRVADGFRLPERHRQRLRGVPARPAERHRP